MPASKTLISGKVVGSGSVVLGMYGFKVGYRLPLYVLPSSGKGWPRSPVTGRDAMITPIWLAFGGRDGSPGNAKVERKVSRDMANGRPEDIAVAWQQQLWRRCVPQAGRALAGTPSLFRREGTFPTPKPGRLLHRILL